MKNKCVICTYVYKQELSKTEHLSLLRLIDFCYKNNILDKLLINIPKSFDFNLFFNTYISKFFKDNNINSYINYIKYDDICFSSINAYNNMLLLSKNYYGDFCNDYDYMLIYQLDGYIFDNQLEYFLNKNYDFIGGYYLPLYTEFNKYNSYENIEEKHLLMNGGVSLKNIKFCIDCISNYYNDYLKGCEFNNIHKYINEDTFFSMFYTIEVNAIDAIKFSLNWAGAETHYAINNFEYPFCCHGIDKNKFLMKLVEKYNKENNLNYSKYI